MAVLMYSMEPARKLAAVRQKNCSISMNGSKPKVRRLLRDPKVREGLSYPNATVHGDHYVLPVAVNHRHKIAGIVHRVSGTGENGVRRTGECGRAECRAGAVEGRGRS